MNLPTPDISDIQYALGRAKKDNPYFTPLQIVDRAWQILSWQYAPAAIDEAAIERQLQKGQK